MKNIISALLVLFAGCSFKKNPLLNQTQKGHEELYTEPEASKLIEAEGVKRIVIAATNDIEAHFTPHTVEFRDEHNPAVQRIQIGGDEAISSYLNILRDHYKDVLLVDSGDIFSSKASVKEVQAFYGKNNYDALTVGLNDFNLKLPKGVTSSSQLIRKFAKKSDVPVVLSNLYDVKTARGVEWKGTAPYVLKNLGGIKIGIIGLIPDDIVSMTPVDNRLALFVENMVTNTLRQARLLRSLGADLIVVLTHQGIQCGHEMAQQSKLPLRKVNFDPRNEKACELDSVLGTYLERLPPHLIDVVVGGRIHEKMANFVNGNLVLGNFEQGKSIIYAEFFVDVKNKKILKDKTVVHQPVMLCHEFFKKTNDCFTQDPSVNHAQRVSAKFLGRELQFTKPTVTSLRSDQNSQIDFGKALVDMNASLAFAPVTSNNSQLIVLKLPGHRLLKILEEDYNNDFRGSWHPSPFTLMKQTIHLSVGGEEINPHKNYSILADLEGLQIHKALGSAIFNPGNKAQTTHSWSSFEMLDSISTRMAAGKR